MNSDFQARRTRTKIFAIAALGFFAGLSLGVVGTMGYFRSFAPHAFMPPPPPPPMDDMHHGKRRGKDPFQKHIMQKLSKELALTKEQKIKVEKILEDGHKKMRALWIEECPKKEKVLKETLLSIRKELSPEQVKKLDKVVQELDSKKRHKCPPLEKSS